MPVSFSLWAEKPKVLHMLTSFNPEEAKYYIDAFEKDTDIQVKFVRLSSGSALARLQAERRNPRFSIWFAGPNSSHIAAGQKGLLASYSSPKSSLLPAKDTFMDKKQNHWVGIYAGFIAFAANKQFLSKNKLQAPTSWRDLLKPQYKGKIAMAFPFSSGTAYTILATLLQVGFDGSKPRSKVAIDKGFAFAKKLDKQVGQYLESGSGCIALAGTGEFPVCISFSHDIAAKGISKGLPLTMSFPKEGTGSEIGGMALIKGGPETGTHARTFYDWALSKRAQDLYQRYFRVPLNRKAKVGKDVIQASSIKLVDFDNQWAGERHADFIGRWREETGN